MARLLRRTSFTARLIAITVAVMMLLIVIDYLALLEVPRRIARDTVEIALRENVQALNATFRNEVAELREQLQPVVEDEQFAASLRSGDEASLREQVASVDPTIELRVREPGTVSQGTGPIVYTFRTGRSIIDFYQPVTDVVLNRAAAASGEQSPFAIERDGRFLAASAEFPAELGAEDVGGPIDAGEARLDDVEVDGESLHVYTRSLTSDPTIQLHALSTPRLEQEALSEISSDVRSVIGAMTFATVLAFLLIIFFTNRTVRTFAGRVRSLADGDYGTRMRVRGNDAFADLAGSVNRLSDQLAEQVGQLEQNVLAFSRTLETLEEGICVWTSEGEVQFWNRGAEQLTGLPRERADRHDPVVTYLAAERTPGSRRVTLPVRRGGGGLVVDLVVTQMPDGGVLQTFRDTTMADLLQQTQRNFMATAAHELRTPITTILGFSDTLVNPELELTDRQREEFVTIIREHAHDLQRIADAFFTNHQLANERVEVSIAPVTLEGVVDDALRRAGASAPGRENELAQIAVAVPNDTVVLADRRALVGVLGVLVENAIKYGEAPMSVTVAQVGSNVSITVADQGPGIDPHHHARLFDPFYRVDVDMRSGIGGAGLGLFTARKLVEAMHGTIRVLSAPGAGATFVVDLPMAPGQRDGGGDDAGSDADGGGDDDGGGGSRRGLRLVG